MGAYLGVDIGGTSVKWALVDDAFNMIDRGDTPTDFSTSEEVVQAIVDIANAHAGSFEAVGVSAPGLIFEDDPDGTIYHGGALTYMHECPIGRILHEKLGVPVAVRNDGKAAPWASMRSARSRARAWAWSWQLAPALAAVW